MRGWRRSMPAAHDADGKDNRKRLDELDQGRQEGGDNRRTRVHPINHDFAPSSWLVGLSSLRFVGAPWVSVTILVLGPALLGGPESIIITGAVRFQSKACPRYPNKAGHCALSPGQAQRCREVAHRLAAIGLQRLVSYDDPRQFRQIEAPDNETQDRSRVVLRLIHTMAFRKWRNDDGRNARARSPPIGFGGRHMVPETTVLVIGYDNQHMRPLGAFLEMRDHIGDVLVSGDDFRIARMLVQIALRFVECDRRQ